MKITIAGAGYVGLASAALLAKKNNVFIIDTDSSRVDKINNKNIPFEDEELLYSIKNDNLSLITTTDPQVAYFLTEIVIIAVPTNFDQDSRMFETTHVEEVLQEIIHLCPDATVVIRSTLSIGCTNTLSEKYGISNLMYCPEFLREGRAYYDIMNPSRIIVGVQMKQGAVANLSISKWIELMQDATQSESNIMVVDVVEAEAIKLISNAFLAMRVAFFNEIDSFAEIQGISSKNIIDGICMDYRIGNYYNNPSFGYGGYCLPKDTRQLLTCFGDCPHDLIEAIIRSNETRKDFIVNKIISLNPKCVGVYRLEMKYKSDNYRNSSIIEVVDRIRRDNIRVVIFDPNIESFDFKGIDVIHSLKRFCDMSDIILTNRMYKELEGYKSKVYTRDLYNRD